MPLFVFSPLRDSFLPEKTRGGISDVTESSWLTHAQKLLHVQWLINSQLMWSKVDKGQSQLSQVYWQMTNLYSNLGSSKIITARPHSVVGGTNLTFSIYWTPPKQNPWLAKFKQLVLPKDLRVTEGWRSLHSFIENRGGKNSVSFPPYILIRSHT